METDYLTSSRNPHGWSVSPTIHRGSHQGVLVVKGCRYYLCCSVGGAFSWKAAGLGAVGRPPVALAVTRAMGDRDFKAQLLDIWS